MQRTIFTAGEARAEMIDLPVAGEISGECYL